MCVVVVVICVFMCVCVHTVKILPALNSGSMCISVPECVCGWVGGRVYV